MNDDTYEGILNQDDTQDFFNGDDARPFYPERAETIVTHTSRARTHYDGCHRVHPECALVKVTELEKELESETKWAKQYHDDWVRARDERDAAEENARLMQDRLQRLIDGAKNVDYTITVKEQRDLFGVMLFVARRNYRLKKLFKQANAEKRTLRNRLKIEKIFVKQCDRDAEKAERERDAANERAKQIYADARALAEVADYADKAECKVYYTPEEQTLIEKYTGGAK